MDDIIASIECMILSGGNEEDIFHLLCDNGTFALSDFITYFCNHNVPLLNRACRYGYAKVVRLLGDNNIDINTVSAEGSSLQIASEHGHAGIVEYLLEHGACANTEAVWQEGSPFYRATINNHVEVLKQLYIHLQSLVVETDVRMSLLYAACRHGQKEAVKFWYSPEINLNTAIVYVSTLTDCTEMTPLYAACVGNHDDIVEYLIDLDVTLTPFICNTFSSIIYRVLVKNCTKFVGVDKELKWNISRLHLCIIHSDWFTTTPLTTPSTTPLPTLLTTPLATPLTTPLATPIADSLVHLNISHNQLKSVPQCVPWLLPHLKTLDASHNYITQLQPCDSEDVASHLVLNDVNLSHNQLVSIPTTYFMLPSLKKLSLHDNLITTLDTTDSKPWTCLNLERLDVSSNKLTTLPKHLSLCTNLMKLYAANNNLTSLLPPWPCPLELLNVSNNQITEFPASIANHWAPSLKQLYISSNQLTGIQAPIVQLENLEILDASHNAINTLAIPTIWTCKRLVKLNLGHNHLGPEALLSPSSRTNFLDKIKPLTRSTSKGKEADNPELLFPYFLSGSLHHLSLCNNGLISYPQSISKLESLRILNLSNNPGITTLHSSIATLTNCQLIKLSGCSITNLSSHLLQETSESTEALLIHMKMLLRRCQPCHRMKMVILGKKDHGKTSLVSSLTNHPNIDYSRESLGMYEWTLRSGGRRKSTVPMVKLNKDKSSQPDITFNVWDLPGSDIFQGTQHVLYTPNTYYLLVWNILKPLDRLKSVVDMILNVHICCPGSRVLIVATHIDKLIAPLSSQLDQIKSRLRAHLTEISSQPILDVVGVSNNTGVGIDDLRVVIYNTAMSLTVNAQYSSLIGRMVPQSNFRLQSLLLKEREVRKELPILHAIDLLQLVDSIQDNDITSTDYLNQSIQFMHEQGDIISFEDKLHGSFYIIDPVWLSDLLSHILLSPKLQTVVDNGISDVRRVIDLIPPHLSPTKYTAIYLQLLERFNIAMGLDKNKLILPSQIPRDKPAIVSTFYDAIHRYFKLSFIPPGFWPLVITKIWISLLRYSNLMWQPSTFASSNLRASVTLTRGRPSLKKLQKHSILPWQEGIKILHSCGSIVVESAGWQTNINEPIKPGILVTVESRDRDFVPMGFIVDEMEDILLDCYKGIDLSEVYTICSHCIDSSPDKLTHPLFLGSTDHFLLSQCCLAIYNNQVLECPRWLKDVELPEIVPDLLLIDLPSRLRVDASLLTLNTSKILGRGNFGLVVQASYKSTEVAVKIFPASAAKVLEYVTDDTSSSERTFPYPSTHDTIDQSKESAKSQYNAASLNYKTETADESYRIKVHISLSNMRREASLLSQLSHPCIVSLVGFCIQPMCIVMELAPLGDLRHLLDSKMDSKLKNLPALTNQNEVFVSVLGRHLTYKVVYQISLGLSYLHSRNIIYRDLKTDNILVFSCDIGATINVKLSDYGISKYTTPQGMMGMCGTKGYQAPEVLLSKMYDEKVDMYSLSSVIYEVISGLRPTDASKTLMDMQRNVRAGILPQLKTPDYTIMSCMPYLEATMAACWLTDPALRPTSQSVATTMTDISYLGQCHDPVMFGCRTLGVVDCGLVCSGQEADSNELVWLWEGSLAQRRYHILDTILGLYRVTDVACSGPRVVCMARVNKCIWLGTISGTVEIHTVEKSNQLVCLREIDVKAQPSSILVSSADEGSQSCVFVTTKDSRLLSISRDTTSQPSITADVTFNSSLNTKYTSIFVTNDIWIGGKNTVTICNCDSVSIRHKVDHVFPFGKGRIDCMVTNNDKVWCSSEWSVVEIDVKMRAITRLFEIRGESIKGVSAVNLVAFSSNIDDTESETGDILQEIDESSDDGITAEVEVEKQTTKRTFSDETNSPYIPNPDKQDHTIYSNINFQHTPNEKGDHEIAPRSKSFTENLTSWKRNLFKSSPRSSGGNKYSGAGKTDVPAVPPRRSRTNSEEKSNVNSEDKDRSKEIQPGTRILFVNDSLWISTENGKISILDVLSGAVTAILSASTKSKSKRTVYKFLAGKTNIVCFLWEGKETRTVVWDQIGCDDVGKIRRYHMAIKELKDLLDMA